MISVRPVIDSTAMVMNTKSMCPRMSWVNPAGCFVPVGAALSGVCPKLLTAENAIAAIITTNSAIRALYV